MKAEKHACHYRVFSGKRWDMSGHGCGNNATVFEKDQWWCRRHSPTARAAKAKAENEKWKAKDREREAAIEQAADLIARLGEGYEHYDGLRSKITGHIVLTKDMAERLIARLSSIA